MKLLPAILLLALLVGCSNTNNPVVPSSGYYKGEVAVFMKDSVSLNNLADYLANENNISIGRINSFQYYSSLPVDSIQTILSVLDSKLYIQNATADTVSINGQTRILTEFWVNNFKNEYRSDWELLKTRFQMRHNPYYKQLGVLKVEEGKEKIWIDKLIASNLFRIVELNYIVHVD